jgi:hypothetical protein
LFSESNTNAFGTAGAAAAVFVVVITGPEPGAGTAGVTGGVGAAGAAPGGPEISWASAAPTSAKIERISVKNRLIGSGR